MSGNGRVRNARASSIAPRTDVNPVERNQVEKVAMFIGGDIRPMTGGAFARFQGRRNEHIVNTRRAASIADRQYRPTLFPASR